MHRKASGIGYSKETAGDERARCEVLGNSITGATVEQQGTQSYSLCQEVCLVPLHLGTALHGHAREIRLKFEKPRHGFLKDR